jgi:multiple sugar transport system substrate-binding protein
VVDVGAAAARVTRLVARALLSGRVDARARARGLGFMQRGIVRLAMPLAALLASGCARESDGRAEVVIRFWAMGREGEVVQALLPEFERRNPGVRVHVQQIPWSAAHEKLLTAFVGDATPDVAQLGNTWVPEFVALGALEEIGSWVVRSDSLSEQDFFPGIWATNVIDGRAYGVPWYVDTRVLFYRTDLLAAAGYAAMPQTWEEWRAALRQLKAQLGPDRFPILLPTNEWPQPVILGMQAGGSLLRDNGRYGAFRDPRFRRGFEFYISLFREGLAPAVSAAEISNRYQEFARGNIAMMITGPWEIGEFTNRLPPELQDRWMTAPLPGPDGPGSSLAGGSSLVLFRDSPRRDAAWRLIEYLASAQQQLRFYELTGDLPAHRAAWTSPLLTENRYTRAFQQQLARVQPLPMVPEVEEIVTRVFEHGERVVRGQSSTDAALTALDRDVDRILEKRRWLLDRRAAR